MWLEMSRDEEHGGSGWGFTECLWSPSHKNPHGTWPFWELLLNVKQGDIVVHLRGKTHLARFVGYSIASSNGYETFERPLKPKIWNYAEFFYYVPLKDFVPFADPILLDDVFTQLDAPLKAYFFANKSRPKIEREHIFFVQQSGRLQCLNGAYLSQFNGGLADIIFGPDFSGSLTDTRPPAITVQTAEQISQIRARVGQQVFSDNIRTNFNSQCCFPECSVVERDFLVGAHIARWSDAPELRGETSNGLCFCLFHDKAFEMGYFTLTEDYRIHINPTKTNDSSWAKSHITPYKRYLIRLGKIHPSIEAIRRHQDRIKLSP